MFKRLLVGVVLIVLVVVAGSEVLLPPIISQIVAQRIMSLTGSNSVTVKLEKRPALFLVGGQFDNLTVQAANVKIDKILCSDMQVHLTKGTFDIQALASQKIVSLESVDAVELSATIAQEELANYVNQTVKNVKNATVLITPEYIQVSSNLTLGGLANISIMLEGKLVGEGQKINFVTQRFFLNNKPVGNIGGAALTEIPLIDLKKLPFNVSLREVVMQQGKLVIYTDNHPR